MSTCKVETSPIGEDLLWMSASIHYNQRLMLKIVSKTAVIIANDDKRRCYLENAMISWKRTFWTMIIIKVIDCTMIQVVVTDKKTQSLYVEGPGLAYILRLLFEQ
ncbi:hypothetical protein ACTFIZ_007383 [Dictyostelium cf. discoideum]